MMPAASDRRHFEPEISGPRTFSKEVDETEASGSVARIYREMKTVGGYATVPLLYRRLAVRPDCLDWAWWLLGKGYASGQIQRFGEQLKVDVGEVAPLSAAVLNAQGVSREQAQLAREVAKAFNSANPMNLIAAHLMDTAARSGAGPQWDEKGSRRGYAADKSSKSHLPKPVRPEEMILKDRQLLEWLSSSGGRSSTVLVPTLYRILFNMPALLTLIACRMDPVFSDGSIDRKSAELKASAARGVKRSIGMHESNTECPDARFVSETVEPFRHKVAEMMVVGAWIDALLGEAADD